MKLSEYFEKAKGVGVLATADAEGNVNTAIYARPHFLDPSDDSTLAFIMSDRLCHANVQANPHASYLFMEEADEYVGNRLTLTKIKEDTDQEKIQAFDGGICPMNAMRGKPGSWSISVSMGFAL